MKYLKDNKTLLTGIIFFFIFIFFTFEFFKENNIFYFILSVGGVAYYGVKIFPYYYDFILIKNKNKKINSNFQYLLKKEVDIIKHDIDKVTDLLKTLNKTPLVTFFGSARVKDGSHEYEYIFNLASFLAKNGFGVVSGGGTGVMESANKAAYEQGVVSIGIPALGLIGERANTDLGRIHTHIVYSKYMFVRRFAVAIRSEALIFAGGGIGTMDEVFENIMLMQNNVIKKIPIILTEKEVYNNLLSFLKNNLEKKGYLKMSELDMVFVENDNEKILEIIKSFS